jgi:hypothetical protein
VVGRLPWVFGGFLKIAGEIADAHGAEIPKQVLLLPQFVRYGVDAEPAVWAMSTGIYDRRLAIWIGEQYSAQRLERKHSFNSFISWMLNNQDMIIDEITDGWPDIFLSQFARVCERYAKFRDLLLRKSLGEA